MAVDGIEAELWYGAHPRHPSIVHDGDRTLTAERLAAEEQPGFLVKILAADAPLSIQVHPAAADAQRGFAAEEASGLPIGSAERRYVDASGKPELIRAIGPMRVLCGLRPARESRVLLSRLVPEGGDELLDLLARGDAGLADAVAMILRADAVKAGLLLAAVADGARDVVARAEATQADPAAVDAPLERVARLALDLQRRHPGDVGAVLAVLLQDVDLAPGEALWIAPGTPHAYLSGLGLEVMGNSDNVIRSGLTVKHVDREEFLTVLDPVAAGARHLGTLPRRSDGSGWRRWIVPSDAFLLDEVVLDGTITVDRPSADVALIVCLDGRVNVRGRDGSEIALGPGGAALLAPESGTTEIVGQGTVVHASRISRAVPGPTSA